MILRTATSRAEGVPTSNRLVCSFFLLFFLGGGSYFYSEHPTRILKRFRPLGMRPGVTAPSETCIILHISYHTLGLDSTSLWGGRFSFTSSAVQVCIAVLALFNGINEHHAITKQ